MLLPILFVFGLALVGLKVGEKFRQQDFRVGAALPAPTPRPVSYRAQLNNRVSRGEAPSRWLIGAAMTEAYDQGDWAYVSGLTEVYGSPPEPTPTAPEAETTVQASPIDGVDSGDWAEFCQALRTREPDHHTGRHHGQYEHNLGRLQQLGIEPPATPADQDKALQLDMSDYWGREQKLIGDYSGEVIKLDGEDHPVTASGVLGLLKSAGPQGARSWLDNEADRKRFPHTTDTFRRTNGCF